MRKIVNLKSSRMRMGELQNVLLWMGDATKLLNLQEDGLGAAKVSAFNASVLALTAAMQKSRSTKELTDALVKSDNENKRVVNLIVKTLSVNVFNSNEDVATAAGKVIGLVALKGNFFKGTREYRYSVLDHLIESMGALGNEVLEHAGIANLFNTLTDGRDRYADIRRKRLIFKEDIVKQEVKMASDDAMACYNDLCDWVNSMVMATGSDQDFAEFIDLANQIIAEMNGKVLARLGGVVSVEEGNMTA